MDEHHWLGERFEEQREHLRGVAYRMLGSLAEADDAVQEAWLRLARADRSGIENLGGWLTTVVARVSLDMLRSRGSRREEPLAAGENVHDQRPGPGGEAKTETRKVFNAERKALQVMGLGPEATLEDVKVKYKALVKQHHPDANGGDRSTEDRLIEIIKAYNYLKTVVRAG